MTFPHKKDLEQKLGEELCKVANERAGFMLSLISVLRELKFSEADINQIMKLAKMRDINGVLELFNNFIDNK